jgi:hypothetical protein
MKRNWVKGWNGGLTGPNTPAAPTVAMAVEEDRYNKGETTRYPQSADYYVPVSCGDDTVAIAVGPDREEIAELIARAPALEERVLALESVLLKIQSICHPSIDRNILKLIHDSFKKSTI